MRKAQDRRVFLRKGSDYKTPIQEVQLTEEYRLEKQLGTGRFGYITLAKHKGSQTTIALKMFPRDTVKMIDFIREYNYSYFLSPHPNTIETYEGAYSTPDVWFFAQEFSPCASLREFVGASNGGLPEDLMKRMLQQVLAALQFMHAENLVHRNIQAKNVLIFDQEMRKVKLTDFGLTRKEDTMVKHFDTTTEYHAPELCDCLMKEQYAVQKSVDVWAVGILIYFSLRGRYPWEKASIMAKPYWEWEEWMKGKRSQLPNRWSRFTEKGLKLFRKTLAPKEADRCSIKSIIKTMSSRWSKETKGMCVSADDEIGFIDEADREQSVGPSPSSEVAVGSSTGVPHSKSDTQVKYGLTVEEDKRPKRRSFLHNWIANTIHSFAVISEQVVSATE